MPLFDRRKHRHNESATYGDQEEIRMCEKQSAETKEPIAVLIEK